MEEKAVKPAPASSELQNELTWSRSRARQLEECPRQYYYSYYGSWGGWKADADPRVRQLYVLKQLKTRPLWAGQVVHEALERVMIDLQQGVSVLRAEELVEATLARMRQDFRSSVRKRFHERPKTLALYEHEYGLPVSDSEWKENAEHVAMCIRNFFTSDVYENLQRFSRDEFLEIEKLADFPVRGIRVWVKLDACLKSGPGLMIIDWKTGRPHTSHREDHAQQLACYALYAAGRWGVAPHQIDTLVYHLAIASGERFRITEDKVQAVRDEIEKSMDGMRAYLADPDTNTPLPEEEFALAATDAPCRRCNYRAACPRFTST